MLKLDMFSQEARWLGPSNQSALLVWLSYTMLIFVDDIGSWLLFKFIRHWHVGQSKFESASVQSIRKRVTKAI